MSNASPAGDEEDVARLHLVPHQKPLQRPVGDRRLDRGRRPKSIRLIGFGVANIQSSPGDDAPTLFADPATEARQKRERLSAALDALHEKGLLP